jgi:hypothetical protein
MRDEVTAPPLEYPPLTRRINMNINQLMADLKAHSPHARGAKTRKANKELADKLKRERTFKSVCTEMRVG